MPNLNVSISDDSVYHYNNDKNIANVSNFTDDISKFLDTSLKSQNISLFIGSGCSVGAIPLMGSTMQDIIESDSDIKEKVKEFIGLEETSNFKDIEGFLNWLQNGMKYIKDEDSLTVLKSVFENTKSKFIATIPEFTNNQYVDSCVLNNYIEFYKKIFEVRPIDKSKVNIFTTNYDLFTEFSLENLNVNCTTGFSSGISSEFDINQFRYRQIDDTNRYKDKWQLVNHETNLYKLHGSINWYQDSEGKLFSSNHTIENHVIYPTELKHRETSQTPYSELFREFNNVLQKQNTTLLIIGYGFPDDHINNIIEQNLKNNDFKLIVFSDVNENGVREFYNKHKEKSNFHLIGGKFEDATYVHHFNTIVQRFIKNEVDNE